MTTLQIASQNSHLEICHEIFPYSNPRISEYDDSPLDLAAIKDDFDVFELIFRNIKITSTPPRRRKRKIYHYSEITQKI